MVTLTEEDDSSSSSGGIYDVFLSFRYEDIGKKFADHLHSALYHSGFRIFRRNEDMERGENINSEVQKAIKGSRMSIIVFSKGYASSSWCLDELEMILQHKKISSGGHHVLPIFYDVDPSDVRKQMGSFKEAFQSYKEGEREKESKSMVDGWKAALKEAADLAGMNLQNEANGHEAKFIQKVVEVVRERLRCRILSMPIYPIGINSRAKFILSWLNDESRGAGMLAICGIGGLGKTTIAKYVYNLNWSRFHGSSFLADIAEVSKQQNGLVILQTQLLSDILNERRESVNSVDEGIVKIQDALKWKSVLLVLDDVETQEQIEAIVGNCDWLHTGSKIIITSRDKKVVQAHKICMVYEPPVLYPDESLELFSWHAFGQHYPNECFEKISKRLVNHCGGLPLAIKILGASLSRRCLSVWESQLKKLIAIPNYEILKKIKISFDLLDNHDKELFLHIACFFVGYDKDYVVPILDGCGFYTDVGIQNLLEKCLLTSQDEGIVQRENSYEFSIKKLTMHQLLQEMGREIVRQESPMELGNRSRIWDNNDSLHILSENSGTEKIEGLVLNMQKSTSKTIDDNKKRQFQQVFDKSTLYNVGNSVKRYCLGNSFWLASTTLGNSWEKGLETNAFTMMRNLKFLVLNYVQLGGNYEKFPKGLRWLCWHGFPLQSIPSDFLMERLVILEMRYSKLRNVWSGTKNLKFLKILDLSNSHSLSKTPNFSLVLNLEKLILENCTSLVEIHESVTLLNKLVWLNLRNCVKLSKLPRSIGRLKSLETLDISGCSNLEEWPAEVENMDSLKVLLADGVGNVKAQCSSIWPWSMKPNRSLKISFTSSPPSLVHLSLAACNLSNDDFPTDIGNLFLLEHLDLSNNPICSFPDCLTRLTRLKNLVLDSCNRLRLITKLQVESLRYLSLGRCISLEKITSLSLPTDQFEIYPLGCESLVEVFNRFKIEPIENTDMEIVSKLGLSNWESLGVTNVRLLQRYSGTKARNLPLQVHSILFHLFNPDLKRTYILHLCHEFCNSQFLSSI